MVDVISLWLPILVSAVGVHVVSSIIHMFLPYHRSDWVKIPSEGDVMESLRKFSLPPGDYVVPWAGSPEVMKSDEYKEKVTQGPVIFMTVFENGMPKMGKKLVQWFVYSVIVSIFAAYVASRAVSPDSHYLEVFRFVGVTAFAGYSLALMQNAIWYRWNCASTLKSMFDGLLYALVTAGIFGWLWPRG